MMLALLIAAAVAQSPALTLDKAIETALAHQPQLRQARSQVKVFEARTGIAKAALRPQVSATGTYQIGNSRVSIDQPGAAGQGLGNYSLTGNVSQLLFDFNQAQGRADAAKAQYHAQFQSAQQTALQVILDTCTAFFNARANQSLARVAAEAVNNQERHLRQITALVQVGTRPPIDRAQGTKDLANARVQLIKAQAALGLAKAQLNQAMGSPEPTDYELADDTMPAATWEDAPLNTQVEWALAQRPDLAALTQQVSAQQFTVDAIEHNIAPTLRLTGAVGSNGVVSGLSNNTVTGGVGMNWPVWTGGAQQEQMAEAHATLESLIAQADALKLAVRLEVEQARLSVTSQKAAVEAAAESRRAAKEQLRLAEGRYSAGVGSVIELGDAQLAYTTAAAQEVQETYRLAIARAQLRKALGKF